MCFWFKFLCFFVFCTFLCWSDRHENIKTDKFFSVEIPNPKKKTQFFSVNRNNYMFSKNIFLKIHIYSQGEMYWWFPLCFKFLVTFFKGGMYWDLVASTSRSSMEVRDVLASTSQYIPPLRIPPPPSVWSKSGFIFLP